MIKKMIYFQEIGSEFFGISSELILRASVVEGNSFAVLNRFFDLYRLDIAVLHGDKIQRVTVEFDELGAAMASLYSFIFSSQHAISNGKE